MYPLRHFFNLIGNKSTSVVKYAAPMAAVNNSVDYPHRQFKNVGKGFASTL